jgi:haloalkane dehalogenase
VSEVELKRSGRFAYREAASENPTGSAVLCLHGFPESSYMWNHVLAALADAGRRAIAPDLPAFGDSDPDPPGTWEQVTDAVEEFRLALGLERVALVMHDWGGLIGLRWACDHPGAADALVISSTGFFPDGRWHGMANALREEGQGEQVLEALERDAFASMLQSFSAGFDEQATDEYWKPFESEAGRQAVLTFYRTCEFSKLEAYEGKLEALSLPALILWGEKDDFAPLGGAHRFKKQLPKSELVVIEGAGHFVYDDEPERTARQVVEFLTR